jgi:hypothetical protein
MRNIAGRFWLNILNLIIKHLSHSTLYWLLKHKTIIKRNKPLLKCWVNTIALHVVSYRAIFRGSCNKMRLVTCTFKITFTSLKNILYMFLLSTQSNYSICCWSVFRDVLFLRVFHMQWCFVGSFLISFAAVGDVLFGMSVTWTLLVSSTESYL